MINSYIYFVGKKLLRSKSPLQSWCVVESQKLETFGKLRSTPTRSGVLFEGTPLRVKTSSSCKRPMHPARR